MRRIAVGEHALGSISVNNAPGVCGCYYGIYFGNKCDFFSINSPPDGCNSIDLIVRGRKLKKPGFESSVVLLTYPQGWGLLTKGVVYILSGSVHCKYTQEPSASARGAIVVRSVCMAVLLITSIRPATFEV